MATRSTRSSSRTSFRTATWCRWRGRGEPGTEYGFTLLSTL
jgi:hypothetical protein